MLLLAVPISNCPFPVSTVPCLSKGRPSLSRKAKDCRQRKSSKLDVLCLYGGRNPKVPKNSEIKEEEVLGRNSFPPEFVFGASSAAYQSEGAWNVGGKGPSIWDTFTHNHPEKISDRSNGDVAVDSYHQYKGDVKLMKEMGMDAYRFSISWPRILPGGSLKGGINQEGIQYYNNLINELKKNGIEPYVTLFHWDTPQALEDEYGGFLDRRIVDDFKDYCEVCFNEFGDRVKHWITVNEPAYFSGFGYGTGACAPGRCSRSLGCSLGDSMVEPYIVAHNLILAHAEAAMTYKNYYQAKQGGEIGITLSAVWFKPYNNTHQDIEAADRALDFELGWFMDPVVHGDYPFRMKVIVRDRLPYFTKQESRRIRGSYDFIGINYYYSKYARGHQIPKDETITLHTDESYVEQLDERKDGPIGFWNGSWIYVYPNGIKELLSYIRWRYNSPTIYITENGISDLESLLPTKEVALEDNNRKYYISHHLAAILEAMRVHQNRHHHHAFLILGWSRCERILYMVLH